MKYSIILALSFVVIYLGKNDCYGQQVTSSSGGQFDSSSHSLSWTIGEPICNTIGDFTILTQGFQQPSLKVTSIFTHPEIAIEFAVYPNPVISKLTVSCTENTSEFIVTVVDISGVIYYKKDNVQISESSLQIDFYDYVPGIYILNISDTKGKRVKSYRIVKQ